VVKIPTKLERKRKGIDDSHAQSGLQQGLALDGESEKWIG
jgi:hypothetical protein